MKVNFLYYEMCVMLRDPPLYFGIVFDMLLFREPVSTLLFVYGTEALLATIVRML